jgi:transglutaminase-like putative cysteine protease
MNWRVFGLICAVALPAPLFAAANVHKVAPPPSWVQVAPDPVGIAPAKADDEAADYLIVDRQARINERTNHYVRTATRINNRSAVEDESRISINVDPASERLVLHTLRVIRDGKVVDQLRRARINTIQRESELEDHIVDGQLTVNIILEDVRVGDIVDYSYTSSYADPAGDPRASGRFSAQWSTPVRYLRIRLLYPEARAVQIKDTSTGPKPQVVTTNGWTEHRWERRDLPAIRAESQRPDWHLRYPRIEFSEFADWGALRDWALPKYALDRKPSAALAELIAEVRAQPAVPARIMKAVGFVQEEVRYTGIEIGERAYQPAPPSDVLARRYGDCKDKTLLLVELLRASGIDAAPALVSTDIHRAVTDRLPAPGVFDHVIARVRDGEATYWIDATATGQSASLETLVQADFGMALVLAPDSNELEPMPKPNVSRPEYDVLEVFDLGKGVEQPGVLQVVTRYRGANADSMRRRMRSKTIPELTEEYLDYYHGRYPSVRSDKPIELEDDRVANEFVVRERYWIDEPFELLEKSRKREFNVEAYAIEDYVKKPDHPRRTSPLALEFPLNVRHRIDIKLPEEWPIDASTDKITGPGFRYVSSVDYKARTLKLDYKFQTTADHVPVAQLAQYLTKIEQVSDDLYYSIWQNADGAEAEATSISTPVLITLLLSLGLAAAAGIWLWRMDVPEPPPPATAAPVGLTGWMILPLIGTYLSVPVLLWALRECFVYFDAAVFDQVGVQLGDAQLAVVAKAATLLMLGAIVVLVVAAGVLIVLVHRRRRSFPRAYILFTWVVFAWALIALWLLGVATGFDDKEFIKEAIGSGRVLISAIIWTAYMLTSQRVRATFRAPYDANKQPQATFATAPAAQ